MVKSALNYIKTLEYFGIRDIVVSLKASNVNDTLRAYRKMSSLCDYPLHLGVTATGTPDSGAIKSAILIGALLLEGIGDTIRISLTDKPQEEVKVARYILEAVGLGSFGPEIISCPTCGRCQVDLIKIARELENKLSAFSFQLSAKRIKVALMGCEVNGPGEAREADIGVAFGKKEGWLFKKGKPVRKVPINRCADILLKEISKVCKCVSA
jgi:(E)-4-hydroxy-3-methylbut-2-enyl-diphosphate synthase